MDGCQKPTPPGRMMRLQSRRTARLVALPLLLWAGNGCAVNHMAGQPPATATLSSTARPAQTPKGEAAPMQPVQFVQAVSQPDFPEAAQPVVVAAVDPVLTAFNSQFASDSHFAGNAHNLANANSNAADDSAGMTLEAFESLAFSNNPTLSALAATTQKAAGFRTQVGLKPNPVVGYQAMQLADRGTDQHTAFIEQEFVTGDKLALNRRVLNEALRSQTLELDTQRLRVATDVQVKFYQALAAQRRSQLIEDFQSVTNKGLELAEMRMRALEGSKVDVLQAKVQKNEIDLALQQAQVAFAGAWRELAALAGTPNLAPTRLNGELPEGTAERDWDALVSSVVQLSPEYQAAQARVSRATANLRRQDAQAIPNITAQIAAGVDNATDSGMLNLQFGAPIPIFNKNQGNIAAARAEYCRAVADAHRIELAISARMAAIGRKHDAALAAVTMYSTEILPNAKQSLELAEVAYTSGETNFIQVLVSRRTFFDSNLLYIDAQSALAQARSMAEGYALTGALDPVMDDSGDDSLHGLTFSQQ